MKKLLLITILAVMCMALLPPALPSSFHGYTNLRIGQKVYAISDGVRLTSFRTFDYNGQSVYSISIGNFKDGAIVYFVVNKIIVGQGVLHSGTSVRVDLEK